MKPNANVNIERLETALRTLRETNRKIKTQSKELDSALERLHSNMQNRVYSRHGKPFGPGENATRLWHEYRQRTTQN